MNTESRHILSYWKLLAVLGCLLVLTAVTVASSRIDVAGANIWITLLIASTKGGMVLLFFMHLKYERPVFMYAFLATILLAAVFISFLFWDVAYRAAQ